MDVVSVDPPPPPLPPKTRIHRPLPASATAPATPGTPNHLEQQHLHSDVDTHVVKIRISPVKECIRISVNGDEMVQQGSMPDAFPKSAPYFFYNPVMSSGQVSPSDTLDSGTCSDLDGTPPPLPKKTAGVTVTVIGAQHKRAPSLTSSGAEVDSDDNESNISCDSLNSGELPEGPIITINNNQNSFLPHGLLQDIRTRTIKLKQTDQETEPALSVPTVKPALNTKVIINQGAYVDRKKKAEEDEMLNGLVFDTDRFYDFHLNEHDLKGGSDDVVPVKSRVIEDETFAGYKDILNGDGSSTIRSAKGTIRGVKNRVRAGIATFLQIHSTGKSYKEKDAGKVVVYSTTMGIVRETYNQCMKVKKILRTLLVKFEERDLFMSSEFQGEIRERMRCEHVLVPQVFVDGQHIGDAETIERLNETGELRRILKAYKSMDACTTCQVCGGYRLLPCPVCNGSKKSVHRNHFTTEFVALKCMNCDEVGLVRCTNC